MDSNNNYLVAYGYTQRPVVMDFIQAIKELSEEKDLLDAIPNLKDIIDYISFDVLEYDAFVEYLTSEQNKRDATPVKKKKKKRD